MGPSHLKLAWRVLLRRPFFTAVSLFAVAFTLTVLLVATALLDHAFGRTAALTELPTEPYATTKRRMRAALVDHVRATLDEDMARLTPPQG